MDLVVGNRGTGYFSSYILQRIRQNKNFVGAITGQTGSGKSYSALRLAETLDPDFDVRNVCFSPREFMDLVNGKSKSLKRGSCIVFDEIQVSMSHVEYQSLQAKVLNYVFQTFRHKNFILFMTSPHFSFINASLRKLFHARIETISINQNTKQCTLKPMLIQVNQRTGDIYEKYLRVYNKEMGVVPLKSLKVSLPSDELLKAYEEKKNAFTRQLNEHITRELERADGKDKPKPLTEIQERILKSLGGKNISEVAKELNISERYVYSQMGYISRKGYRLRPIKEGIRVLHYEVSQSEQIV